MKKLILKLVIVSVLLHGCNTDKNPDIIANNEALLDVNLTSATYNSYILHRDYLGRVSAWYFGHST